MTRLPFLPHPVLTVVLTVLWLVLESTTNAVDLVPALLFGLAVPPLAERLWEVAPGVRRWRAVPTLLGRVAADILVANLHVARLVWTRPVDSLEPRFLVVPTALRNRMAVVLLAEIVTNTPGTIHVDLDEARWELLVHALDERDPARAVAQIRDRYERLLKEIFEC